MKSDIPVAPQPEKEIALAQLNHAMTRWLKKKEEKDQVDAEFNREIKELYQDMIECHDRANSNQMSLGLTGDGIR